MKLFHAVAVMSAFCAFAGLAATTTAKTTTKKSAPSKSTSKTSSSATKSRSTSKAKGKTVAKAPAATWRTRQQVPTPDRYKEIQQALIDKGYLKGEPTGVWDADSAAAMQRFQQDQKLTPTGKITAASLIGLGLGAKSAGAPEAPTIKSDSPGPVPAAPATGSVPAATPAPQ